MTDATWIIDSLGAEKVRNATTEAGRRRVHSALGFDQGDVDRNDELKFIADALELRVLDFLDEEGSENLQIAAAEAFQVARVLPLPATPIEAAQALVHLGCLGILGDRGADVKRILSETDLPQLPTGSQDWGMRVNATIQGVWLRLFRKRGWDDLDEVQRLVANLRSSQGESEPQFLRDAEERLDVGPAWQLVHAYHLAKAAEILGTYQSQGSVDGRFDIREQLDSHFDRAIAAAGHAHLIEQEMLGRLLARTARRLVDNSIWSVTRAVNSRVTNFVTSMMSRNRQRPMFEMLPPQRRTLREEGLLGSGHRSVVVSLPTSSGKTLISQFRMLQALNQFDHERGWVAYVAPTRALVNQITLGLRRDFADLGVVVEKVSPALEIDGLEAGMLSEEEISRQFRILVATPEKFDLMLRGGWEQRIGRPLTLVVVDEAHGIAAEVRGLRLELLLATINRECRHAQFLLLTPFVPNAEELARWLDPDSNQSIELGVDWVPNDRVIAIARPKRGQGRGEFRLELSTLHTTKETIELPEAIEIGSSQPLGLTWSGVSRAPSKIAAATAEILAARGPVIVLVQQPRHSWGVAETLRADGAGFVEESEDLKHIQRFLEDEMGPDFPLSSLLEQGIGVHHSGLSEDTRTLVEWLMANEKLRVLVATTTIAQGVNFPVSGVVFASHQYPYGQDMPPEDFWNIAGRAGRVDQGDLGIIALSSESDARTAKLKAFVERSVDALNSTLVEMVQKAQSSGDLLKLEELSYRPEWSAFLQFLAHTYRQIGNHEEFAAEVERVLRGTFGFQALRRNHLGWSQQLVRGVYSYAERIKGKPLALVDATGFSWESVSNTLVRLDAAKLAKDVWSPDLFGERRSDLQQIVGLLLQVPELRKSLQDVTGGTQPNGDTLARIICDWVQGRSLTDMSIDYFGGVSTDSDSQVANGNDATSAMTKCCSSIFGNLTQTASWGLAALQSIALRGEFETMSTDEQRVLRNIPARVYYGVNSDEAVALRLLGVPRSAATRLAQHLGVRAEDPLHETRSKVQQADAQTWSSALGDQGRSYHRVWSIIEGMA